MKRCVAYDNYNELNSELNTTVILEIEIPNKMRELFKSTTFTGGFRLTDDFENKFKNAFEKCNFEIPREGYYIDAPHTGFFYCRNKN